MDRTGRTDRTDRTDRIGTRRWFVGVLLTVGEMGMASTDWQEIYRDYSPEEVEQEIERMKREATLYTAQNLGDKAYQKSLDEVRNRLHAAIRVRNERRGRGGPSWGVPDFSGV
jgi:hypothetical protein